MYKIFGLSAKLCLLGYSGHGLVVGEALKAIGYKNLWYAEEKVQFLNPLILNYAGFENFLDFPWADFDGFALGVGDNTIRRKIAEKVLMRNKNLLTVIHPQALVSESSVIERGTFVARGACINPLVVIETGVIINTGAIVEHECHIASFAHIGPGAVLTGSVKVGMGAFIGANAVVKQGVEIGEFAFIGAGTVVIKDIPSKATVVGNPARILKIEK